MQPIMRDSFLRAVVVASLLILCAFARADVRAGYTAPLFTIPFTSTAPKIDGIIDDAEWQNAFSISALQTTEGRISSRQTQVWMCWDADYLYLAMRSPLRPGERVMQAYRQTGRDNSKIVFDDSYEIWLNADTLSPDGEKVFFQYLGNYAGAEFDVMFEPTVGNSRPGWESGWKPANRITPDGKFWEMEVAIPRQSIYRNQPFEDGEALHGLFVRNFKRPWEQNSVGGSGSFSVPETHCTFVLSKTAPAIHLLGVANVQSKSFGIDLAACGVANQPLHWSFDSDDGTHTTGNTQQATRNLQLTQPGDGSFRIKVVSSDGSKTYLDFASRRAFGDLSATTQPLESIETPKLTLTFNPVKNYVRIDGDFIDDDNRSSIARYHAEVLDDSGKSLAHQELHLDDLAYVHGLLNLGDCAPGNYTARLIGFDSTGKQIFQKESAFTKKDPAKEFPWWNTTAGNIEKVIAPWTPIQHHGDTIDVWGRSMQIGDAGLPKQITTQNIPILAAPISLVADETSASSTEFKTKSDFDHRVIVDANSVLCDLKIASKITTEFDGLYKVRMTLSPTQPTSVKIPQDRYPPQTRIRSILSCLRRRHPLRILLRLSSVRQNRPAVELQTSRWSTDARGLVHPLRLDRQRHRRPGLDGRQR